MNTKLYSKTSTRNKKAGILFFFVSGLFFMSFILSTPQHPKGKGTFDKDTVRIINLSKEKGVKPGERKVFSNKKINSVDSLLKSDIILDSVNTAKKSDRYSKNPVADSKIKQPSDAK